LSSGCSTKPSKVATPMTTRGIASSALVVAGH
jgi:hypothetical protein